MFRRLFLACLALLLVALVAFGLVAGRATRNRVLAETERELRAQTEALRVLVRVVPNGERRQAAVREAGSRTGIRATVIAPDGRVLADSDADPASMEPHHTRPEVVEARLRGAALHLHRRHSATVSRDMMYFALLVEPGGPVVRSALPLTRLDAELAALYRALALAFLAVAAGGACATWLLARRITRPLDRIAAVARAISAGDFSRPAAMDAPGELAAVAAAIQHMAEEIARRVRAAEAEAAQLEALISSMREGVVATDSAGRILRANAAARDLLGLPADCRGSKLWEAVRLPGLEDEVRAVLERGASAGLEREVGPRALAICVCPVAGGPEGGGAVLVAHDATEARRYDALRREFVANVSHELRTPLSLVSAAAETLREGAWRDPERAPEFLETIERHAGRLAAIVADLLELSRLESGGPALRPAPVELRAFLARVREQFAPLAERRRHSLALDPLPDLWIEADPDLLERAVANLVDNALKYTPEGGHVRIGARAGEGRIEIAVADDGPGIPEAQLPRIFERFYRVDKSRSRELGGTGLGLAIVKHVAALHGGGVEVDSRVGAGSTFRVWLPRTPDQAGPRP